MPLGLYRYEEREVWRVSTGVVVGWFILLYTVVPIMLLVERWQKFRRALAGNAGPRR